MHGMSCYMIKHQERTDKDKHLLPHPETVGQARPRVVVGEGVCWWCSTATNSAPPLVAAKELGYTDVTPSTCAPAAPTPPRHRPRFRPRHDRMNENDYPPNYHWCTDVPENIDVETVRKVTTSRGRHQED